MTVEAQAQSDQDPAPVTLRRWWQELEKSRGDRAALRRCATLSEIMFEPAYHRLYAALAPHGWTNKEAVAAVAGLAALVRKDVADTSFAKQMAQPRAGSSSARVSGLRFRRLLKYHSRDELYPALARVVRSLDGQVDLVDLAKAAYWWGEAVRKRWAFDYYTTAPQEQ